MPVEMNNFCHLENQTKFYVACQKSCLKIGQEHSSLQYFISFQIYCEKYFINKFELYFSAFIPKEALFSSTLRGGHNESNYFSVILLAV